MNESYLFQRIQTLMQQIIDINVELVFKYHLNTDLWPIVKIDKTKIEWAQSNLDKIKPMITKIVCTDLSPHSSENHHRWSSR